MKQDTAGGGQVQCLLKSPTAGAQVRRVGIAEPGLPRPATRGVPTASAKDSASLRFQDRSTPFVDSFGHKAEAILLPVSDRRRN